jgi:hypothetical protein
MRDDTLVDSAEVRRLAGGRSHMWVYRSRKRGSIPEPDAEINGRHYWRRSKIIERLGLSDRNSKGEAA